MSYPLTRLWYSPRTLRQWRINSSPESPTPRSPAVRHRWSRSGRPGWNGRQLLTLLAILAICSLPFLLRPFDKAKNSNQQTAVRQDSPKRSRLRQSTRLSETVGGHDSEWKSPLIDLRDSHELLTSHVGPDELSLSLEQNRAEPLSMAAADFDEDGVPDLVIGYAHDGRGIVSLLRGN